MKICSKFHEARENQFRFLLFFQFFFFGQSFRPSFCCSFCLAYNLAFSMAFSISIPSESAFSLLQRIFPIFLNSFFHFFCQGIFLCFLFKPKYFTKQLNCIFLVSMKIGTINLNYSLKNFS